MCQGEIIEKGTSNAETIQYGWELKIFKRNLVFDL